jgi:hypothetical protein
MSEPPQQSEMGPMTTRFAKVDPGPSQSFGVIGAAIAVVGAILLVVGFTAVNWYSGGGDSKVSNIRATIDVFGSDSVTGSAKVYFGWLGWALVIVAVLAAVGAVTPTIGGPFRVVAIVVSVAGIIMTFLAIELTKSGIDLGVATGYSDYLKHARLGFYFAVIGFLLTGVGAAVGPADRKQ